MASSLLTKVKLTCQGKAYEFAVDSESLTELKNQPAKYLQDMKTQGLWATLGMPSVLNAFTDTVTIEVGNTFNVINKLDLTGKNDPSSSDSSSSSSNNSAPMEPVKAPINDNAQLTATGRSTWTKSNIMLMLELRKSQHARFSGSTCKKAELWHEIASKLGESGYILSGDDCSSKWRNLLMTYRKNREKHNDKDTISWEYYELMDTFLHDDPCVMLPRNKLSISSVTSLEPNVVLLESQVPSATPFLQVNSPSTVESGGLSPLLPESPDDLDEAVPKSPSELNGRVCKRTKKRKDDIDDGDDTEDGLPAWFAKYLEESREADRVREEKTDYFRKKYLQIKKEKLSIERQRVAEITSVKQLLTVIIQKLG